MPGPSDRLRGLVAACALFLPAAGAQTSGIADLQRGFADPSADSRPMMRWWWFGPAVTKPELEREMRAMKAGGIGGFEVQPVYPLALDDEGAGIRNLPYLSDDFIDALRFTARTARDLGMRMDLTLGSGWPFGGPHIPVSQAAGRLRVDKVKPAGRRVPLPAMENGERLIAAFAVAGEDQYREATEIRDGALQLPAGAGGEVWFFISSRTGQQVKRAAVGAEGYVLDHYDRTAVSTHLRAVGDRLMQAFDGQPPYAVFCDSLEVYGSDWTPGFLEQFRERRGYDLKPLLPSLVGGTGPKTLALREDWGRTLTELADENFYRPMHEWSEEKHTQFRIQGYGLPPATLSSYALADLPEGEGAQWKILRASRWAASASHILGRPVTSSETWTWLHSPSFRATPLDLKAEADLHFLQGINQLIGHGWPYTPPGVEYPGWRLYAAAVFDDQNPWYVAMPDITAYLHRMSWLLRQGKPANDVALYLSNSDGWAHLQPGSVNLMETERELIGPDVVARVLEAGYNLDFCDDGLLDKVLAGYRVVVLPGVETMPAASARKLEEFVRRGGIVVPTRRLPDRAPGYRATETENAAVRRSAGAFAANLARDENRDLAGRLHTLLPPDVALSPAAADFGFVHRSAAGAEVYFVANTGNAPLKSEATFRVAGLEPDWWDPMTGRSEPAAVLRRSGSGVTVPMELAPFGSRVIVFSKRAPAAAPAPGPLRTIDLSSGWSVRFGDSGRTAQWDRLRSWSDDEDTRYFSGVATYEKTVSLPADFPRAAARLDFGEGQPVSAPQPKTGYVAMLEAPVREAAVVWVNGRRAGAVWCPPYTLEIGPLLGPGENRIRIQVGNTAMNYMAGHSLPDYRLLNLRYGLRFEPQDMDKVQAIPSGLLGPVKLLANGK